MRLLYEKLSEAVGRDNIYENEPMSRHTSFRVGGPAALYVVPGTETELIRVIAGCRDNEVPFRVIGNGSNLLVSDKGFDGVIIEIGKRMSGITLYGTGPKDDAESSRTTWLLDVQAGASLAAAAAAARDAGLTGLEFAGGIPGTVGGACVMNAGAYDGEIKNILKSVRLTDEQGNITEETPRELEMGYRHSNILPRKLTVLSAKLMLRPEDPEIIADTMRELNRRRYEKQPLEYPSAGSTFKRPEGFFAGKLIEDCGLKGFCIGDAMVSEKHAGFVVNRSAASARDIFDLTEAVIRTVYERYGVTLEREIQLLGDWE